MAAPRSSTLALALALALRGAVASGEPGRPDDDPAVRSLRIRFSEGQSLETAGRWADALDRFRRVARARSTPEVLFHVALCLDHLGRLREARETYRRALAGAGSTRAAVVDEATRHLRDVDARLPRLDVVIAGDDREVLLFVDGEPLPPSGSIRLDPGPHLVTAKRSGSIVSAIAFSVQESSRRHISLQVYGEPRRAELAASPLVTRREGSPSLSRHHPGTRATPRELPPPR